MIESALLETACSLGVGALLGIVIFLMYRKDRKASEKVLERIIDREQDSREKNTAVLSELITYLRDKNGNSKR